MREIKLSQFRSIKEMCEYLNDLAENGQGAEFFDEYNKGQLYAKLFIENYMGENIQFFEYEYLLPGNNHDFRCIDEERRKNKYVLLNKFKGRGSYIEEVRDTVLLFIHQFFSALEIYAGNVLIDAQSKSAIFTGSFTVSKMFNFVNSPMFDTIEKIYIFPYLRIHNSEDTPFNRQKYFKIIIAKEVKKLLQERDCERTNGVMYKMNNILSDVPYDKI